MITWAISLSVFALFVVIAGIIIRCRPIDHKKILRNVARNVSKGDRGIINKAQSWWSFYENQQSEMDTCPMCGNDVYFLEVEEGDTMPFGAPIAVEQPDGSYVVDKLKLVFGSARTICPKCGFHIRNRNE